MSLVSEIFGGNEPEQDEQPPAPCKIHSVFPTSFVAFDTETTGMSCADCIIELGAVKVIDGIEVGTYSSFIEATAPISPGAARVNHITQDMLCGAPAMADVAVEFFQFAEELPLIAHNAPFDVRFLAPVAERLDISLENRVFDTLKIARDMYLHNECGLSQCALASRYGIRSENEHRALDDAAVLSKIWLCMGMDERAELALPLTHCQITFNEKNLKYAQRKKFAYPEYIKISDITPESECINCQHPLFDKSIVFTGEMSLNRKELIQLAVNVGAVVRSAVSQKTNYLVVGKQDCAVVGDDGLSSKEEVAYRLIDEKTQKSNLLVKRNFQICFVAWGIFHMEQFELFSTKMPDEETVVPAEKRAYFQEALPVLQKLPPREIYPLNSLIFYPLAI